MTYGHIATLALGALAIFGVITSTVYSLMVAMGVRRFCRRAVAPHTFLPPVSVLKPVHGDEPDLEQNLTSFFQQDYPDYEILFCARYSDDLGLAAARRVAARFPQVTTHILTCGDPPWPNART
ncbi:MAG: glycosyl transferase, partial [Terracidiphilus sp.]